MDETLNTYNKIAKKYNGIMLAYSLFLISKKEIKDVLA